jgi:RNA polymerase sigma-70 factor, ECF subfamily
MSAEGSDVTGLLVRWSDGDDAALERLLPLVYDECRRIAAAQLRRERSGHTLNPTALVHELYLHLVDQRRTSWQNRAQFFCIAGRLMRRVLVDHARARRAQKRDATRMVLAVGGSSDDGESDRLADILAIDEALHRLGERDPDQQRIVELRYFGGLTVEETAHVLGRSTRTVKREWQMAKAWLYRELSPGHGTSVSAGTSPPDGSARGSGGRS